MGPPSYMRTVVDQNVGMRRMIVTRAAKSPLPLNLHHMILNQS